MRSLIGALLGLSLLISPAQAKSKVYAAFFMGQGGYLFSGGMPILMARARAQGVIADIYYYTDYNKASPKVLAMQKAGYKIALIGYSLGCSTITYMNLTQKSDLLIALAESSLAQNYAINKTNTKRSVLWHGWDFLSNAGLNSGFNIIHETLNSHLTVDTAPDIQANVLAELARLQAL